MLESARSSTLGQRRSASVGQAHPPAACASTLQAPHPCMQTLARNSLSLLPLSARCQARACSAEELPCATPVLRVHAPQLRGRGPALPAYPPTRGSAAHTLQITEWGCSVSACKPPSLSVARVACCVPRAGARGGRGCWHPILHVQQWRQ